MSRQNLVQSSLLSCPWPPVRNDSTEDWTKILPASVLAKFGPILSAWLPVGNDSREDWTKFCRECSGKIWSNPLCCHVLGHLYEMTAQRIGPNFACKCPWQTLVQSSLLVMSKFCREWPPVGNDSREDWTKLCPRLSWQNLVQSFVPSFPWLLVGNDSRDDWTKFCRKCPGKIWSNPLCCHVLGHL